MRRRFEETGTTFAENAIVKAVAASQDDFPALVVADDSGLEVDALAARPGFTPRVTRARTRPTRTTSTKLLRELRENAPRRSTSARFRCVLALAREGRVARQRSKELSKDDCRSSARRLRIRLRSDFRADGFEQDVRRTARAK